MSTRTSPRREKLAAERRAKEQAQLRRRRRWRVVGVVATSVAALGTVAALAFAGAGSAAPGFRADKAAFDLPALEGDGHVRLADHAGRPVVVNFFASWCVYCNEELPGFTQVSKATRGRVDFVGVDTNDTGDGRAMARRFDLRGAGFSVARDIGGSPAAALWSSFGAQGLPVTAFYDARGRLVDFSSGMLTQRELEQRLQKDFGVTAQAEDAARLAAPVIPLIPRGAFELLRNHAGDPSWTALDVRTPAEFGQGHLPGAANLDVEDAAFADRVGLLDKDKSYVVYCHTGNRSSRATALMHSLGFKHVYDVQGGIAAWEQSGLPVTR